MVQEVPLAAYDSRVHKAASKSSVHDPRVQASQMDRQSTSGVSVPSHKRASDAYSKTPGGCSTSPDLLFMMSPEQGGSLHAHMASPRRRSPYTDDVLHPLATIPPRFAMALGPDVPDADIYRSPPKIVSRSDSMDSGEEIPFMYAFPIAPSSKSTHTTRRPRHVETLDPTSPPRAAYDASITGTASRVRATPPISTRYSRQQGYSHTSPSAERFTPSSRYPSMLSPESPPSPHTKSSSSSTSASASDYTSPSTSRFNSAFTSASTSISGRSEATSPCIKTNSTETISVSGLSAALAKTRLSSKVAGTPPGSRRVVSARASTVEMPAARLGSRSQPLSPAAPHRAAAAGPKLSREVVVVEPGGASYDQWRHVQGTPRTSGLDLEKYLVQSGVTGSAQVKRGRVREVAR